MAAMLPSTRSARLATIGQSGERWAPRLRNAQASWSALLASSDPASEPIIRHRLAHAIAFAACSVHCSVGPHERAYATMADTVTRSVASGRWAPLATGTGPALPASRRAIDTGIAWAMTVPLAELRTERLADLIRVNVHGLGSAKAPFAAALAGDPEAACIDTHGLVDILGHTMRSAELRRNSWRRHPGLYADDVRAAFGETDVAYRQWARFAELVPAFAETGHAIYFAHVNL